MYMYVYTEILKFWNKLQERKYFYFIHTCIEQEQEESDTYVCTGNIMKRRGIVCVINLVCYIYTFIHVTLINCLHVHIHVCIYVCMYVCIFSIYVHTYMYVVHIHTCSTCTRTCMYHVCTNRTAPVSGVSTSSFMCYPFQFPVPIVYKDPWTNFLVLTNANTAILCTVYTVVQKYRYRAVDQRKCGPWFFPKKIAITRKSRILILAPGNLSWRSSFF